MRLAKRVSLITGAGSGIGRAAARLFAREGARVVVADLNAEAAGETVRLIETEGGSGSFVVGNVSVADDVQRMVNHAVETHGGLQILYNNVSVSRWGSVVEMPEADWDLVIDCSLKSVFLGCKYGIPAIQRSGGGAIVNTGGTFGFYGTPDHPAYCAAKGGVIALTKQVAQQYAPAIRCNAVCPGFIDTPRNAAVPRRTVEAILHTQPLGMGYAEDVANAALFLVSDESRFITGTTLLVDGGQLSGRHLRFCD